MRSTNRHAKDWPTWSDRWGCLVCPIWLYGRHRPSKYHVDVNSKRNVASAATRGCTCCFSVRFHAVAHSPNERSARVGWQQPSAAWDRWDGHRRSQHAASPWATGRGRCRDLPRAGAWRYSVHPFFAPRWRTSSPPRSSDGTVGSALCTTAPPAWSPPHPDRCSSHRRASRGPIVRSPRDTPSRWNEAGSTRGARQLVRPLNHPQWARGEAGRGHAMAPRNTPPNTGQ